MRAAASMLGEGAAVAELVAAAQVGVQPVEKVDPMLQLAERHIPESRIQRASDVAGRRLGRLVL